MKTIQNRVISASAGSGKTYSLANRYIDLMEWGAEPDKICALTFTRKAAGEMFDGIVARLVERIREGKSDVRTLHTLLVDIGKLRIGTLDSFASSLAKNFAFELGVSPDLNFIDNSGVEAQQTVRDILADLTVAGGLSPVDRKVLLDLVIHESEGLYSKQSLTEQLVHFITTYSDLYRDHPDGWGDANAIIGHELSPKNFLSHEQCEAYGQALIDFAEEAFNQPDKLHVLFRYLKDLTPDRIRSLDKLVSGKPLETFLEVASGRGNSLQVGRAKAILPDPLCLACQELLANYLKMLLWIVMGRTKRLANVLSQYGSHEDQHTRKTGRITFGNLIRLFAHSGCTFSAVDTTKQYINFRLDGAINHYLLDEFQDTNNGQWAMLKDLVSEVVERSDEGRSLFYVGDLKQSIYGWRGANTELFDAVRDSFSHSPYQPVRESLAKSQRSTEPIIHTLNKIFDIGPYDLGEATPLLLTASHWRTIWEDHQVAERNINKVGLAELITVRRETNRQSALKAEQTAAVIAEVIERFNAAGKYPKIAVVVRQNSQARDLCQALNHLGIVTALEGKESILGHPVVDCVMAALRVMTHPDDTEAVGMLGAYGLKLRQNGWHHAAQARGFEALMKLLVRDFFVSITPTESDLAHVKLLRQIASSLDMSGERDPAQFKKAIENFEIDRSTTAATVSVMTIHKSKGLTFDVVFVPYSDTTALLDTRRKSLVLMDAKKDWALLNPKNDLVTKAYHELEQAQLSANAKEAQEALCCFYVALTRPAYALYMITLDEKETENNGGTPAGLMRNKLVSTNDPTTYRSGTVVYREGVTDWYMSYKQKSEPQSPASHDAEATPWTTFESSANQLKIAEPSEQQTSISIAELFQREYGHAMTLGTAMHDLFSRLTWLDEVADLDAMIRTWQDATMGRDAHADEAEALFRHALQGPLRTIFERPTEPCTLWVEMPFSALPSGSDTYINGQFDRVHLFKDHAILYDFKSSRKTLATKSYLRQMKMYQEGLAAITGFPLSAIRMVLLFTRSGEQLEL